VNTSHLSSHTLLCSCPVLQLAAPDVAAVSSPVQRPSPGVLTHPSTASDSTKIAVGARWTELSNGVWVYHNPRMCVARCSDLVGWRRGCCQTETPSVVALMEFSVVSCSAGARAHGAVCVGDVSLAVVRCSA